MSDEAKWYVVHTYSGYENKVASNLEKTVENHSLQNLIFEIRVPTEKVTEVAANGKTKEVERKIFPGYVIVKMILTDDRGTLVAISAAARASSARLPSRFRSRMKKWSDSVWRRGMSKSPTMSVTASRLPTARLRALSEQWKRLMWTRTTFASWFRCSDVKPRLTWNLTRRSPVE